MEEIFILRRAWLLGLCTRADVDRAFNTQQSPNIASRLMKQAVNTWPQYLLWRKRIGIIPITTAPRPVEVEAETILDLWARGAGSEKTGVFEDDGLPLLKPQFQPSRAMTSNATQAILTAVFQDKPLRIQYVGLRRGERARWRRIWPVALEFTGMYWRLHAQDLEDEAGQHPIKVFVVSRVMDTEPLSIKECPARLQRRGLVRQTQRLRVYLNEQLTADQEAVIRNGLAINPEGGLTWPHHSLYEFKRDYANAPPSSDIVWPLLTRVDVLK
jgi:hypothetical protein